MSMSYDRFFQWYPKYTKYYDNAVVKALYEFLSQPESIEKMLIANDTYGKPALVGALDEVENRFHDPVNFNLTDNVIKQLVGSMVKEIIADFGYDNPNRDQKPISNTLYIKSATYYQKIGKATKRLVKKVTIEDIIK